MKQLHEKKISELVSHKAIVRSDHNDEMDIDAVTYYALKQWAIAVVKEKRVWRLKHVKLSDSYLIVCKELFVIEQFLIDRFELTEKDLR